MSRSLVVEFTKMQGAGNDFLVVDNRWYRFSDSELADLAARWCRRRYGVGADGLLALAPVEEDAGADFRMRYVNADGSMATMCGNGARCLARYAVASGFDGPEVAFDTDAGRYHARVRVEDRPSNPAEDPAAFVRLYVPPARDLCRDVSLETDLPAGVTEADYVWTGTEHLVLFVEAADALPDDEVHRWGRQMRNDPALAPEGANANFVSRPQGDAPVLQVRTYEKGVEAETLSCGTGVLAAVAAARNRDVVPNDTIEVVTRGGRLHVGTEKTARGRELYLEGPVSTVFRGTLELSPADA
jgi:diaminopimelate epimerase